MNTRFFSLVLSLLVFSIMFVQLATSPQSGDGAEQVLTALKGGVLHPPGFPFQAWINRLFVLLPFENEVWRLSLLSLIAHSAAVGFLADAIWLLTGSIISAGVGALSFAFFPTIWYLAVQPEVFSLTHLTMVLVLWWSIVLLNDGKKSNPALMAAITGVLCAVCLSQHTLAVIFLPFVVVSVLSISSESNSNSVWILFSVVFCLVIFSFYASLPLLRTDSVWPDFGKLSSVRDVLGHALRIQYGVFSLEANTSESATRGIRFFLPETLKSLNLILPFFLIGLFSFIKEPLSQRLHQGLALSFLLSLIFLIRAKVGGISEAAEAVLERFYGPAIICFAIYIGYGFERALKKYGNKLIPGVAAIFVILSLYQGWSRANAASDNVADVFREGLRVNLPQNAIYLSHSDLEALYGISGPAGTMRFPIEQGLASLPWYKQQVVPVIDPRIGFDAAATLMVPGIIAAAYKDKYAVVTTCSDILPAQYKRELRGLYFYVHPTVNDLYNDETVKAAVALCPVIAKLRPLPNKGHLYSKQLWKGFWRAYAGAATYLASVKGSENSYKAAQSVAEGLLKGKNAQSWVSGCKKLEKSLK